MLSQLKEKIEDIKEDFRGVHQDRNGMIAGLCIAAVLVFLFFKYTR